MEAVEPFILGHEFLAANKSGQSLSMEEITLFIMGWCNG